LTDSPRPPPCSTLLPYTTLFRSEGLAEGGDDRPVGGVHRVEGFDGEGHPGGSRLPREFPERVPHPLAGTDEVGGALGESARDEQDRKSTRLNSSHVSISYAVFCL